MEARRPIPELRARAVKKVESQINPPAGLDNTRAFGIKTAQFPQEATPFQEVSADQWAALNTTIVDASRILTSHSATTTDKNFAIAVATTAILTEALLSGQLATADESVLAAVTDEQHARMLESVLAINSGGHVSKREIISIGRNREMREEIRTSRATTETFILTAKYAQRAEVTPEDPTIPQRQRIDEELQRIGLEGVVAEEVAKWMVAAEDAQEAVIRARYSGNKRALALAYDNQIKYSQNVAVALALNGIHKHQQGGVIARMEDALREVFRQSHIHEDHGDLWDEKHKARVNGKKVAAPQASNLYRDVRARVQQAIEVAGETNIIVPAEETSRPEPEIPAPIKEQVIEDTEASHPEESDDQVTTV